MQDYPGEELLVVYDVDFKYGQNFYLCTTEEYKEKLLHVSKCSAIYINIHILSVFLTSRNYSKFVIVVIDFPGVNRKRKMDDKAQLMIYTWVAI